MDDAVPSKRSVEHWFVLAGSLLGLVLVAAFAWIVPPDPRGFGTHERLGLPPCAMMEYFHIPCPGCGVTTSVALASRGRVWESIRNQPFGFLVAVAIPLVAAWALVGHFRGRDLFRDISSLRAGPWLWWTAGALAISWFYKIAVVFGALPGPAH